MKLVISTSYGGFSLSKEFYEYYNIPYREICGTYYTEGKWWIDDVRKDPRLIEYIEKFGSKAASGRYSHLTMVEIPKGTKYYIDTYDGCESIVTEDDIEWEVAD